MEMKQTMRGEIERENLMKETMRREMRSLEAKFTLQMRSIYRMHRRNLIDHGVHVFIHGRKAQRSEGWPAGQEMEYGAWVEGLRSPVEFCVDDEVGKRVVTAAPSLLLSLTYAEERNRVWRNVVPVSSARDYAFAIKNAKSCEDMIFGIEYYMELFGVMFGLTVEECVECRDEEIWDVPLEYWFLRRKKQLQAKEVVRQPDVEL